MEELDKLAALVKRERGPLMSMWRARVMRLPTAQTLDGPSLTDHMPQLVDRLFVAFEPEAEQTPLDRKDDASPPAHGLQRFEVELESLASFPERCSYAPENGLIEPEIRQLVFGRRQGAYRALFTIVDDEVRILHIRRAVRDLARPAELVGDQ